MEGHAELRQGHPDLYRANTISTNNPSVASIASRDQDHSAEVNQWPVYRHRGDCNAVDITLGATSGLHISSTTKWKNYGARDAGANLFLGSIDAVCFFVYGDVV
jgi:hypothetical protein